MAARTKMALERWPVKDPMRIPIEEWVRKEQLYKQHIMLLEKEKEEMMRNHLLEMAELRQRLGNFSDQLQAIGAFDMSTSTPLHSGESADNRSSDLQQPLPSIINLTSEIAPQVLPEINVEFAPASRRNSFSLHLPQPSRNVLRPSLQGTTIILEIFLPELKY